MTTRRRLDLGCIRRWHGHLSYHQAASSPIYVHHTQYLPLPCGIQVAHLTVLCHILVLYFPLSSFSVCSPGGDIWAPSFRGNGSEALSVPLVLAYEARFSSMSPIYSTGHMPIPSHCLHLVHAQCVQHRTRLLCAIVMMQGTHSGRL